MRTHVSLNVKDVQASVDFYKKIFAVEPQKQTVNYAKFDLKNPFLNFSLISGSDEISRVNHFGLEVEHPDEIQEWESRLNSLNVANKPEMGSNCCHARQDKVWFKDPDGNAWEVFFVHEQLPIDTQTRKAGGCCA